MGVPIFFLYNFALRLVSPFLVIFLFTRLKRRGIGLGSLGERFGYVSDLPEAGEEKRLWIHAVSVGEVGVAAALLPALKKRYPKLRFVISTVTETGREAASRLAGVEKIIYLPFDFPSAIRRVLSRLRPSALAVVETELWPNLIREANRRNLPVAVVNGRLSKRSFIRYSYLRALFHPLLSSINGVAARNETDSVRFKALGASRVAVTGNLKFDIHPPRPPGDKSTERKKFTLEGADPVIVAGSTHPGEEAKIGRCFKELAMQYADLGLLVAPRHLERLGEVEADLRRAGLAPARWSQVLHSKEEPSIRRKVVILDIMGQLADAYACATVVFIGGSLIPHGGQNPIEAAGWGVPLVFGPHMDNFEDVADGLVKAGGAARVEREEDLLRVFAQWFSDSAARRQAGEMALSVARSHRGAAVRCVDFLEEVLWNAGGKEK